MILLLLAGCVPKSARADALMDAGYVQLACGLEPSRARTEAMLADLDLRLAVETVPAEAFGVVPRGYGVDHQLVVLALQRTPDVMPSFDLRLAVEGWEVCYDCGPDWFLERMGPIEPVEPEPTVDRTTDRGSHTALGGFLSAMGNAGKALFEVGRVIGGVTFGTVMLVPDLVFTGLLWHEGYRMEITDFMFNTVVPGEFPSFSPMMPVATDQPYEAAFQVRSEGPVVSRVVLLGTGVPSHVDLELEWTTGCPGIAHTRVALQGSTFAEALASGLPAAGVVLPLELAP